MAQPKESRLAEILREELKAGKGLANALSTAQKERAKERADLRRLFPQQGVLGQVMQSMLGKGYKYKAPLSADEKRDQTTKAITTTAIKVTAKNTAVLPAMARDMNIMKRNMQELVHIWGGRKATRAESGYLKVAQQKKTAPSSGKQGSGAPSSVMGQVANGLFGAASFAADLAGGLVKGIVSVLGTGLKIGGGLLLGAASIFGSLFSGIIGIGGGLIGGIFKGLASAVSGMGLFGLIALAGAGFLVYQLSKSISGSLNFEELQKGIVESFQKLFGKDKDGKGPLDRIAKRLDEFFETNKFTENLTRATNLVQNTFNTIMSHGIAAAKTLGDVMSTIGQDLVSFSKKWMYEQTENIYVLMGATIGAVLGSTMGSVGAIVGGVLGKKAAEEMFKIRSKDTSRISKEYMNQYGEAGATEQLNKQISTAREFLQTDKNRLLDNDAELNLRDPNTRKWLANFLSLRSRGTLSPEKILKNIEEQERNAPGNSSYRKDYTIGKLKHLMISDEEVLAKITMSKDFESKTNQLNISDLYAKNLADARQQYPEIPDNSPKRVKQGEEVSGDQMERLRELIARGESGGDYNIANKKVGDKYKAVKNLELTKMTVDDVLKKQREQIIFAAGKYQFIEGTLKSLVDQGVVSGNDKFDEKTQDKLADALIKQTIKGKTTPEEKQKALAKVWRALEYENGKSFSKVFDRATVSAAEIQSIFGGPGSSPSMYANESERIKLFEQFARDKQAEQKEFSDYFKDAMDRAFGLDAAAAADSSTQGKNLTQLTADMASTLARIEQKIGSTPTTTVDQSFMKTYERIMVG